MSSLVWSIATKPVASVRRVLFRCLLVVGSSSSARYQKVSSKSVPKRQTNFSNSVTVSVSASSTKGHELPTQLSSVLGELLLSSQ